MSCEHVRSAFYGFAGLQTPTSPVNLCLSEHMSFITEDPRRCIFTHEKTITFRHPNQTSKHL